MPTSKTAEKTGDKPAKPAAKAAKPASTAKPASAAKTAKPKAAASKPAAKTAAKPAAPRKTAAKPASAKKPALNPEKRRYYVEVAAYYIAERRGFHGGSELNDWIEAEAEIDRLLREGILNP